MAILPPASLQVADKSMDFNYESPIAVQVPASCMSVLTAANVEKPALIRTMPPSSPAQPVRLNCGLLTLLNKKAQFAK
jgi:hypothetical protein